MDLGFSRRSVLRKAAIDPAFDFRNLLAEISARQAALPTARAQARFRRTRIRCLSESQQAASFCTPDRAGVAASDHASFNAAVAALLVAGRKSS